MIMSYDKYVHIITVVYRKVYYNIVSLQNINLIREGLPHDGLMYILSLSKMVI